MIAQSRYMKSHSTSVIRLDLDYDERVNSAVQPFTERSEANRLHAIVRRARLVKFIIAELYALTGVQRTSEMNSRKRILGQTVFCSDLPQPIEPNQQ